MKITKAKIILVVIVAYFIIMAMINVNTEKNDNKQMLEDVIMITDGKYNSKNDGKLVLVTGKIKYDDEITFNELDEEIKSFKVERTVKRFGKNEDSYTWEEVSKEENENLYTVTETKEFYIGDYKIDGEGLKKIRTNSIYSKQEKIGNMEFTGLYYTIKDREENPKVGDLRITYRYFDLDKEKNISILAKQTKNGLETYDASKNNKVYYVFTKKIDTKEKLENVLEKNVKTTVRGKSLFIILILGLGIFFIADNKKKKA
ncbi:MAG: TMEM43 family protein [bacterium]|nr:TMEM43 family protein [bacterium]